jgi:lipopolysaccharide export system protein LptA
MVDLPPVSNTYACDKLNRWCEFSLAGGRIAQDPAVAPPIEGQPAPPKQKVPAGTVELRAEQQTYNEKSQTITASGNVIMRYRGSLLKADQVEVDLQSRKAVATGKVSLQRGSQILKGDRFEYDFGNDRGLITDASGEVYRPSLEQDLNIPTRPRVQSTGEFADPPLNERILRGQPVRQITRRGTSSVSVGSDRPIDPQAPTPANQSGSGTITRLRYRAEKLEFDGKVITGSNVRLTNDPFSPPELEVRADQASFRNVGPDADEVTAVNPRVTIEQGFNVPLVRSQFDVSKNGTQDLNPFGIGYDGEDRGGVFLERTVDLAKNDSLRWTISPQYYIQRVIAKDQLLSLNSIGFKTSAAATFDQDTSLQGELSITGLDPASIGNNLRSKISLNRDFYLLSGKHSLSLDSVYRERVFNGSLGFQDVQSSIGATLTSPKIAIGNTGITLDYQAGFRLLNATTDRVGIGAGDGRVTLGRYEMIGNLNKSFRLWEGAGPPVDDRSTYNYSPVPVVPYLQLNTGLGLRTNGYSNGENQSLYGFNVSLQGQVGHFVAPAFDYTGFNIGYSQNFIGGSSPFLFDRVLDNRVITAGINQQLFGPVRVGLQTSINVDNGRAISTDYYVEYSRRTFSILVRYNPALQLGSIGFKLNDLDWNGPADPF